MRCLPHALLKTAAAQNGMFTRTQARLAGVADSTLDGGVGRVSQRVLPGVYAAFTGELTAQQRLRAAALYGWLGGAGTIGIVGGLAACHLHGLRAARDFTDVQLVLPRQRKLKNAGFVVVRRSTSLGKVWRLAGLPVCGPARAIVDASRVMKRLGAVRALVAEGVQQGKTTTRELIAELEAGGTRGAKLIRIALAEVADGVHSVAEAQLRAMLVAADFAPGCWNADLYNMSFHWLARPDALWPEANLVVEVESREWHLSPEQWAATMERTNRLSRLGYDVQQLPPSRVTADPAGVLADLRAAYAAGIERHRAGVHPEVVIKWREAA